jgi:hypothetical protein
MIFFTQTYLRNYNDVKLNGISPLRHYIKYGVHENRAPCPFDTRTIIVLLKKINKRFLILDNYVIEKFLSFILRSFNNKIVKNSLKLELQSSKKRYMLIQHNLGGGVEVYTKSLIQFLDLKIDFIVVSPAPHTNMKISKILNFKIKNNIQSKYIFMYSRRQFWNLYTELEIDKVHIQHNHNIEKLVKKIIYKIPQNVIVTLHDFSFFTPFWNLNNNIFEKGRSLDIPKSFWEIILTRSDYVGIKHKVRWGLNKVKLKALGRVSAIIAPSEFVKNKITMKQNFEIQNLIQIPHPEYPRPEMIRQKNLINADSNRTNVAFLGSFAPYKGSLVVEYLTKAAEFKEVNFFFMGQFPDEALSRIKINHIPFNDRFAVDYLVEKHKIGVFIIPYQTQETYSFALSDALRTGRPIIVSGVGAMVERAESSQGIVIVKDYADLHNWSVELRKILLNRKLDLGITEKSMLYIDQLEKQQSWYFEKY